MKENEKHIKSSVYNNPSFVIIILYFLLIQPILSGTQIDVNANYMGAFELEGGNILMCTDKAIYLYIKDQGTITMQKYFDNIVLYDDFHFETISQFEVRQKCIIILYKNKINIFTEDGQYFTDKSVNFDSSGNYYSLVPYTIQINPDNSNYYYFFVGYLKGGRGNQQFMICYFYLNNVNGDIVKVDEKPLSIQGQESFSSFYGFSCQVIKSETKGEILTCFFHVNDTLIISSFDINTFQAINGLIYQTDTDIKPIYYIPSINILPNSCLD